MQFEIHSSKTRKVEGMNYIYVYIYMVEVDEIYTYNGS